MLYVMQRKNHGELAAHVARVEGQLAAVRAALDADDCGKAARTLLAASRSLSSARALCVSEFLSGKIYKHAPVKDKALLADVRSLMKA
jgi:DNA-binding FrmR family transcriptional regulator